MSIHLYKHNEDAYRAVETMLEEKQMAAVIHPTGTGKSMIAFKLVEQHPHKHFLWLSPSEYIYKTQLENIDTQFSNIEYMSYSRLMKHEDSIDTLHPDYIILDEFHRCGAAEWGKSVRKLLEAYPKAKRLGLSATNIRYLDNQRNMAEELFEGNIASEMTLGEAIVREILPEHPVSWQMVVGCARRAITTVIFRGQNSVHRTIQLFYLQIKMKQTRQQTQKEAATCLTQRQ